MCLETTTSYQRCSATFTHTILCLPYVASETSTLCPQFRSRIIEYEGGGCSCKQGIHLCKNYERSGERSWGFMEELDVADCEREAREYEEMIEREKDGREERDYRKLLAREDGEADVEVYDTAMDSVDDDGEGDENLQLVKDQCRMRRRALDRLQIFMLEELESDKRARLEKAKLERDELDKKNREQLAKEKLQRQKLEEHRKMQMRQQNAKLDDQRINLAKLQLRKEHEQQVTLSRKKLRAAELEKMKAIRDQDSGARDSWTAEQWAAEARLCHRLDKGKNRIARWQKWEEKAAKACEQGDPRDKHRIIVERAEEYFFEMKGMENFYREKAQLPPEKPGQFDLFGPRRRPRKPRSHNPHQLGVALRAKLVADAASPTTEHKPSMMLDFGAEWGQGISGLKEDERMADAENEPEKFVVDGEGVIDLTG